MIRRKFPRNKEQDKKTVINANYNWCVHHNYWTNHSSAYSQGIKGTSDSPIATQNFPPNNKHLQAASAMVSNMSKDGDWE